MTIIMNVHQRRLNVLSKEKILDKMKDLNTSKSPGPDLLNHKILWEIRDEIVHPLQIIFETSFTLGILPQDWRSANNLRPHIKCMRLHCEFDISVGAPADHIRDAVFNKFYSIAIMK